MSLDTIALKCFVSLANTGNFSKTAKQIGRTQSAVSQQITKLEASLGKPLITRDKPCKLTHDGEVFLNYAKQILVLQAEAIDRFKNPQLIGELKFGLPEDFAAMFLADVLANFTQLHPRILLNIECDLTINLFNRFKNHEFDLVLVKMNRPEDFPNGIGIWSEQLEWVGNANFSINTLTNKKPISLVLAPQPCVYRACAIKALEQANLNWHLSFSSPSYTGTIAAVKAGFGITVLPPTMIPPDLTILNIDWLPKLSDIHISLLKHENNNIIINSFEKFVLQKLQH